VDRYDRHRALLSESAWNRLNKTVIVCAGAGGLGASVLELCVRLGPVTLQVWDPGVLDPPDLNRQILYTADDLGSPKAEAACRRLRAVNPEASVSCLSKPITAEDFSDAFDSPKTQSSFVLFDCLDSFPARGELEKIRQEYGCTVFHGGVEGWFGQVITFPPGARGYREVFGEGWNSLPRATKPILPSVVSAVASYQVASFVNWLEDPKSNPTAGRMLLYDGKTLELRSVTIPS
jgi:adenylyltransferase/sulfurtransferase